MIFKAASRPATGDGRARRRRGDDFCSADANNSTLHHQPKTDKQGSTLETALVCFTRFPDQFAQSKRELEMTLPQLADLIRKTTKPSKAELPFLKLARFGDERTAENCLRSNANLLTISGIEADYDAGKLTIEAAAAMLKQARVRSLLYTSASYTPERPRWRVLCPTSTLPPEQRAQLVARLNGLLGGVLAEESFVLSQSYYYGSSNHNPQHKVIVIDGDCIDQRDDLDAGAIHKKKTTGKAANANGKDKIDPFAALAAELDPVRPWAELQRGIITGESYHAAIRDLALKSANGGMSAEPLGHMLQGLMQAATTQQQRDQRWQDRYNDIDRTVSGAWEKINAEQAETGAAFQATDNSSELLDPWQPFHPPTFPVEILSAVVAEFVGKQARVMGGDVASLAMATLGAISGAIDHRTTLRLQRHGTWTASPRLWVLLCGDPSTKKSPLINAATLPLEDYQKELYQEYVATLHALNDDDDKPPPPERYVVYDTTIEKLGELLARGERGLLVKGDEFAGLIGAAEKYGGSKGGANTVRAFWIKAFDGGSYIVDRINRGELFIPRLSVSLIGGIQPAKLRELHGLTSDGLLQRFLPNMMVASSLAIDQPISIIAYDGLIRRLIDSMSFSLTLSNEALEVFNALCAYLHQLEQDARGLANGFQTFIGKLPGVAGSLALVLHLSGNQRNSIVQSKTMRDVHRLIEEFTIPHALEFYRTAESSDAGDSMQRLAGWILTNGEKRIVASDLTSNVWEFRGATLAAINERLSPLVAGGWLVPKEKRVPLSNAWNVNPQVFTQFNQRRKIEAERKARLLRTLKNRMERP